MPSADNWYGLLAPSRTPAPVVAKLHDAIVAALAAPEIKDRLIQSGAIPAPSSSVEFAKLMSDEARALGAEGGAGEEYPRAMIERRAVRRSLLWPISRYRCVVWLPRNFRAIKV